MGSPELLAQKDFAANSGFLQRDGFLTYIEVFDAYINSELGRFHARQPLRYAKYGYDRGEMLSDLGNDVHPLLHMSHTFKQIVNPLVSEQVSAGAAEELSPEDIKAIRLSALVHDIGENEHPAFENACGDIHKFDRTPDHELAEQVIRKSVYQTHFSFLPDEMLGRAEDIIMQTDPADFATRTFKLAEELGYYKTGIQAGEVLLIEKVDNYERGRFRQLARMALVVPSNWVDTLEDAGSTYPHIQKEISATQSIYNAIQTQIRPHFPG